MINSDSYRPPITDHELIQLLVCQAQGLDDDFFPQCDEIQSPIENCTACEFFVNNDKIPTRYHNDNGSAYWLMTFAAKRLAELTKDPLEQKIHLQDTWLYDDPTV